MLRLHKSVLLSIIDSSIHHILWWLSQYDLAATSSDQHGLVREAEILLISMACLIVRLRDERLIKGASWLLSLMRFDVLVVDDKHVAYLLRRMVDGNSLSEVVMAARCGRVLLREKLLLHTTPIFALN